MLFLLKTDSYLMRSDQILNNAFPQFNFLLECSDADFIWFRPEHISIDIINVKEH